MKRLSFLLLAITLTLVVACQSSENQNRNANTNANKNQGVLPPMGSSDKMVVIYVHDAKGNPGYYTIDDPGSITLNTSLKQKVYWCVSYDGPDPSLRPDDVVIDNFRTISGPSIMNPFGNGSPGDNVFDVPAVQINFCPQPLHAPKPGVVVGTYKYTITAKVGGADRGNQDPGVIITD
jgi:hypothetical protein